MNANIEVLGPGLVSGWAIHPRLRDYPMTVHAVCAGQIAATTLADIAREDAMPGFELRLPAGADLSHLRILLAETDAYVAHADLPAPGRTHWTIEDLIALPQSRAWVARCPLAGACCMDGLAAGLLAQTVIDLLCEDLLGRRAGAIVTEAAMTLLAAAASPMQGWTAVRRLLIDTNEYRLRRIYVDRAPGAIFSEAMVAMAASRDFVTGADRDARPTEVSALPLLALEGEVFLTACYRQILRKEPDRNGLSHYMRLLAGGKTKIGVIKHLAAEFETISAGIRVIDLPHEE